MKLFYSRGTCSHAAHIALREAGLSFELEKVDLKTKQTDKGLDYLQVNPNGYVPTLELDDGQRLTEAVAILQYVADRKPELQLAPVAGSMERYKLIECLSFLSSELHKNYSPLFSPATPEEYKFALRQKLSIRLAYVNTKLADRPYLMGSSFTVADAYLFVILNWSKAMAVDLSSFANLTAFRERVAQRPAVQAARKAEEERQ
jgi:glutathione S-transferase